METMSQEVPTASAQDRLERLFEVIRPRQRVLTAYSGGIDSTLVAAAARQALGRENAPAAVGDSASLPRYELDEAKKIADQLDFELIEVAPREQDDPGYQANAGDRCYFCKTHLYTELHELAARLGIDYIVNGTVSEDLGDHRPGLVAADEAEVISPLLEAGFTKQDVRDVARHLGLPNWDKPASACLASRIPHGTPVTRHRLEQVEKAEGALRQLGFSGFRVRHHEQVARLELPWQQVERLLEAPMRERVIQAVKDAGFLFVSLDLEGFRSGSGNALLTVEGERASV
ncbi:MAG: ATP-dependent sacrificial sulfur transferase LarE [Phycisphaeraceae bacterium]